MFRTHLNANLKSKEPNGISIRLVFLGFLIALRVAGMARMASAIFRPLHFNATAGRVCLLGIASVIAFLGGCQTLSLPAIDPTGNRIFTPNGFTTLINPHDPNNGYPSTQPAFQTPPNPPACTQTGDKKLCKGCLSGKGCLAKRKEAEEERGRCGQLLLTPTRIVAPVGGEVILLAGVCGKDGNLVTDEPIEFMISQDGVGEFVQVGDDAKGQRTSLFKKDTRPKVEKLGIDFARGRTSREPWTITRGTSTKDDDLPVRKGQTWISLTSPSEGISKVTVLAPDSDVWDQRRQTATIYWMDAEWQFPTVPANVQSGEIARLVTRVMRAEGSIPAEGWKVRYRVLNPEIARFVTPQREGSDFEEVVVDNKGIAAIGIVNGQTAPHGTAMVEMEVVRPVRAEDNIPELPLGRQTTTVTWSAPELRLEVGGPEIGVPGQPLQYFASLANIGDLVAENVILSVIVPAGMTMDSPKFPPSSQSQGALRWEIGPLMPRSAFELSFNLTAQAEADTQVVFEAAGSKLANQQKPFRTLIQRPQVTLQIQPKQNPNRIEVGNEAVFEVVVTNNGNQTLNDVRVSLQSAPGLQHTRSNQNSVVSEIGFLNPRQSKTVDGIFRVDREGELTVKASVSALGQELAMNSAFIVGIPAVPKRPSLSLILESDAGQNPLPIGTVFSARWAVNNTGPVSLRTPILSMQHSPNLQVMQLSEGADYVEANRVGRWTRLRDILPGERLEYFTARFRVTSPGPASVDVVVESESIGDRKNLTFQTGNNGAGGAGGDIVPSGNPNAPPGGFQPNGPMNKPELSLSSPSEKRLSVTIQPVTNAIRKGDVGTYEITIANLVNKPDQRVALSILTPKGAVLKSIRAKDLQYKLSNSDRQIDLEPIKYFRANDSFSCVIQLRHDEVAAGELVASVTSLGQTSAISESHRIHVLP